MVLYYRCSVQDLLGVRTGASTLNMSMGRETLLPWISFYIDIICLKELRQDLGTKKDSVVTHLKEVKKVRASWQLKKHSYLTLSNVVWNSCSCSVNDFAETPRILSFYKSVGMLNNRDYHTLSFNWWITPAIVLSWTNQFRDTMLICYDWSIYFTYLN